MNIKPLGRSPQQGFPSDAEGRSLIFRASELEARFWLIDMAESEYDAGNFEGAAMLMHIEYYLTDRLVYELEPPPKGCIKLYAWK